MKVGNFTHSQLANLFRLTFEGSTTQEISAAVEQLHSIPFSKLFSSEISNFLANPSFPSTIKESAMNFIYQRIKDFAKEGSDIAKKSAINLLASLLDNSKIEAKKTLIARAYIFIVFADDSRRNAVSQQLLLKVLNKIQFYYNKKNSALAGILYQELMNLPWKVNQVININSYSMPLMLYSSSYHLKEFQGGKNCQENYYYFFQGFKVFTELITSMCFEEYAPKLKPVLNNENLAFLLNQILREPFFRSQPQNKCFFLAYRLMISMSEGLRRLCLLNEFPITNFIEQIAMKDFQSMVANNGRIQKTQIDLITTVMKCKTKQSLQLHEIYERLIDCFFIPVYEAFSIQYRNELIQIQKGTEVSQTAQNIHDSIYDACYQRQNENMFISLLKLMMIICEKQEKFYCFMVGELLKVVNNVNYRNMPVESGLLLLTVLVEKIMPDAETEKKIQDYLANFRKEIFLQNRILSFFTMELYNAYIDEFEDVSYSDLPTFLLNLIFSEHENSALGYVAKETMIQYYKQSYPYQQEQKRINDVFQNLRCQTIPLISLIIQRYHSQLEKKKVGSLLEKMYNANVLKKIDEPTLHEILELACEIVNYDEYRQAINFILKFVDLLFQSNLPFFQNYYQQIVKFYKICLQKGQFDVQNRIQWLVNEAVKSQTFPSQKNWEYEEFLLSFYRHISPEFLQLLKEKIFYYMEVSEKIDDLLTEVRLLIIFHWLLRNKRQIFTPNDTQKIIQIYLKKANQIQELPENTTHFLAGKYNLMIIYIISYQIPMKNNLPENVIKRVFSASLYAVNYDTQKAVNEFVKLLFEVFNQQGSIYLGFHRVYCHEYIIFVLKSLERLLIRTKRLLEDPQMFIFRDISQIYHDKLLSIYQEMDEKNPIDPFLFFQNLFKEIKASPVKFNWFAKIRQQFLKEISDGRLGYILSTQKVEKENGEHIYQRFLRVKKFQRN